MGPVLHPPRPELEIRGQRLLASSPCEVLGLGLECDFKLQAAPEMQECHAVERPKLRHAVNRFRSRRKFIVRIPSASEEQLLDSSFPYAVGCPIRSIHAIWV